MQEQRAIELYYAGRYDDANIAIHEAVDTYRALGDTASRTRAQAWLGPILIHAGRLELAASELQSALNELPPDADPAARAELLAKLARVEYRLDHNERAIDLANQALAIAEHHRFVRTVADAMTSKGTALASLGRTFEAMNLMRGGMELAKREGDFDTTLRAGNNLGGAVFNEEGARAAVDLARENLKIARSVGDVGQTAWQMQKVMVGIAFAADPAAPVLAEAAEVAALDLARTDRRELVAGLLILNSLLGEDITELKAEADELFDDPEDPQARVDYQFWTLLVPLAAGDFKTSALHAARATELQPEFGVMGLAAILEAIAGDYDACRLDFGKCAKLPVMGKWDQAARVAARGAVAILDGKRDEGSRLMRDALRQMRELEDLLTSGLMAMAMVRMFEPGAADARAAAEQSIADFERMGSPALVKVVSDVLASVERTPAPAGAPSQKVDEAAPIGA